MAGTGFCDVRQWDRSVEVRPLVCTGILPKLRDPLPSTDVHQRQISEVFNDPLGTIGR